MHRRLFPMILAIIPQAASLTAQDQRVPVTTSIASWGVTVTGAEIYDRPRTGAEPAEWRTCNLRVDVRLQYLGESGEALAPQVQVANEDADTSAFVSVSVGFGFGELLPWLLSGKNRPQTRSLAQGQMVGGEKPVSYCFQILPRRSADIMSRDFGKLTLIFADTPALILKPTITN